MTHILVIDDDALTRTTVNDALVEAGYRVTVHRSAWGASKLIHATRPDLVVLDLTLPVLSGEELVELLRANPELAATRVILYSSRNDVAEIAARIGANGWVRKSDGLPRLLEAVREHVGGDPHR